MRDLEQDSRNRGGLPGMMDQVKQLLGDKANLTALAVAGGAMQGEMNVERLRAFAMKCVLDFLGQEQKIQKGGLLNHYLPEVVGALEATGRNTPEDRTLLRTQMAGMGLQRLDADSMLLVMTKEHYQDLARSGHFDSKALPMTGARAEAFTALWEQASPETRKAIIQQQSLWPKVAEFWKNVLNGKNPGGQPPADPWGVGAVARSLVTEQLRGDLKTARSVLEQIQRSPGQFDDLQGQLQAVYARLEPRLSLLQKEQADRLLKEVFDAKCMPAMSNLLLEVKQRQLSELAEQGRFDVRDPQFEADERYKPFTLLKPVALSGQVEQRINRLQSDWAHRVDELQGESREQTQPLSVTGYVNADPKFDRAVTLQGEISLPLAPEYMKVTDTFGRDRGTRLHKGTDYGAPLGASVLTPHEGTVVRVGFQSDGWGNYVVVKRSDGLTTLYAHLAEPTPLREGASVQSGQVVGKVGATGNAQGSHLHLEAYVEQNGQRVYLDPVNLYTLQRGVTGERVKSLQRSLKDLHYYTGNVDGEFWDKTEAALGAFQKTAGLPVTGKLDSLTSSKLTEALTLPAKAQLPQISGDRQVLNKWPGKLDEGMIEQAQQLLNLPVTGLDDARLKEAVRILQRANGLADDGTIGEKTWELLRAMSCAKGEVTMVEGRNMSMLITDIEFRNKDAVTVDQIRELLKGSILANQSLPIWRLSPVDPGVKGAYLDPQDKRYWLCPTGETCDPAMVIYNAAQKHGINPLVILAQLQKEQGLVEAHQATNHTLALAMGFGVPDKGGVGTNFSGFDKQIDRAAARMAELFDKTPDVFPRVRYTINYAQTNDRQIELRTGQKETIPWAVEVQNRATWALYVYTPHIIDWKEWEKGRFGGGNLNFAKAYGKLKDKVTPHS